VKSHSRILSVDFSSDGKIQHGIYHGLYVWEEGVNRHVEGSHTSMSRVSKLIHDIAAAHGKVRYHDVIQWLLDFIVFLASHEVEWRWEGAIVPNIFPYIYIYIYIYTHTGSIKKKYIHRQSGELNVANLGQTLRAHNMAEIGAQTQKSNMT